MDAPTISPSPLSLSNAALRAVLVSPAWPAGSDLGERLEAILAGGGSWLVVLPSGAGTLGQAAGALLRADLRWELTLCGRACGGEALWLCGVRGEDARIEASLAENLAVAARLGTAELGETLRAGFGDDAVLDLAA